MLVASGFEAGLIILAAIVVGIFIAGDWYGTNSMRLEAIQRGYGIYCPDSGDFAWAGECGVNAKEGE
jgi:hypothetical protein